MMSSLRTVAAGLLLVPALLVGCGVRPQDAPEPVSATADSSAPILDGFSAAGPRLTVYLVRGTDLAPVDRRTDSATTQAALGQLVDGPTRTEAGTGIRTALPPEVVGVEGVGADGVATVEVTRGFTGITGGNQLLAVAQVVWTLTDLPAVTGVRFTVEGTPVEVPTDAGLTSQPVDRDDYRSVAPTDTQSSASTGSGTSSEPAPPPD